MPRNYLASLNDSIRPPATKAQGWAGYRQARDGQAWGTSMGRLGPRQRQHLLFSLSRFISSGQGTLT